MQKKKYCCLFCLFILICFSFFFLLTSIVIFILSGDNLEAGISWNQTKVTTGVNTLLPFNPHNCPKNKYFYSKPFLTYLRIESHFDARLTLTFYNTNVPRKDNKLDSCQATSYSSCALNIPSSDNIFAFVMAQGEDAMYTVDWGCYYLNLPFLVSIIVIFLAGICIILSCCFLFGIPIQECLRGRVSPDMVNSLTSYVKIKDAR